MSERVLIFSRKNMPEYINECIFDIYQQNNIDTMYRYECVICECYCRYYSLGGCECCQCEESVVWNMIEECSNNSDYVVLYQGSSTGYEILKSNIDSQVLCRLNESFSVYADDEYKCKNVEEISELYEQFFMYDDINL